jgi:hypothetical protein
VATSETPPNALEKILDEASEHILAHHVSLGSPSPAGASLPPPNGSGTFVRFSIQQGFVVYGILTAAHVMRWLKFGRNDQGEFVGLSKLQKGNTLACSITFPFVYHIASIEHFHSQSTAGYRPDIAFVALGINERLPDHELIQGSSFYSLDDNQELKLNNQQIFSAFCKGAGKVRPDGLLNTFVAFGGGEFLINGAQSWAIPNTTRESIAGASGAGFWRFFYDDGALSKALEGVVIAEGGDYDYVEAMATPYLYDIFLPQLKRFCTDNLSWFRMSSSQEKDPPVVHVNDC